LTAVPLFAAAQVAGYKLLRQQREAAFGSNSSFPHPALTANFPFSRNKSAGFLLGNLNNLAAGVAMRSFSGRLERAAID
jgi:hypothetical protein